MTDASGAKKGLSTASGLSTPTKSGVGNSEVRWCGDINAGDMLAGGFGGSKTAHWREYSPYHNAIMFAPPLPSTCSQHICLHRRRPPPPFLRPIAPLPPCFQISRPRHFHPSLPQPTRDMIYDIALFRCDRAQPSHVASLAHWVQRYGYHSYHHRVDLALTRSTDLSTPSPRYSAHAVLLSFPLSVVIDGL